MRTGIVSDDAPEAVKHYAEVLRVDFYYYRLKPFDKVSM
jgi:predicted HAD superfamily phosphohydrolase YqeG